jgi:Mg2+ and Co2+ transporter CorA
MKNPLLVPELREMLAANRIDEIRDFSSFTPPEVAAEFLGALDLGEQQEILRMLARELRSQVFAAFEDEGKLALLAAMPEDEAVEMVAGMPEEVRDLFLERVPDDQRAKLRERFRRTGQFNAQQVVEAIDEAAVPEEKLTAEEIASEVNRHLDCYRFTNGRAEQISRPEKACWVRIVNPSKENLPLIADHFKVPVDFLTASLDVDETARVEIEDHATLFIVKIPYFDENNVDVLYFTIPVGIILTQGMIITVCTRETSLLQDFADNKVRNVTGGHRFILQFILRATVRYLAYLKQLNNAANIIQKKLELESRNKQLIKLFNIEKSLVYFTTSLKSNLLMLERVRRTRVLEIKTS